MDVYIKNNILGQLVNDSKLGICRIIEIEIDYIKVKYEKEDSVGTFIYPYCFLDRLSFVNDEYNSYISKDIAICKENRSAAELSYNNRFKSYSNNGTNKKKEKKERKINKQKISPFWKSIFLSEYGYEFDYYLDLALQLKGLEAFDIYRRLNYEEKLEYLKIKGISEYVGEAQYYPLFNTVVIKQICNPFNQEYVCVNLDYRNDAGTKYDCKNYLYQKPDDDAYYMKIRLSVNRSPNDIHTIFRIGIESLNEIPEEYIKVADKYQVVLNLKNALGNSKINNELNDEEVINYVVENHFIHENEFLTRTVLPVCVQNDHNLVDIFGAVEIMNEEGKRRTELFKGAHCNTCGLNYILESEYKRLNKSGRLLCNIVVRNYWKSKSENDLARMNTESKLHKYGYNVNAKVALSDFTRHSILETLISEAKITKYEICTHLETMINLHRNNPKMKSAVNKWNADLEHIRLYENKNVETIKVNTIIRNQYK